MRRSLLPGVVLPGVMLAAGAALLVVLGAALELDLDSTALLGSALGAVVALVPERSPLVRLGGFAAGFVIAWIGYVVRASMLPDTSGGRAVAVVVVLLLCVAVAAATADRLPLWTLLLGTAGMVGAYERTFAAAPPELIRTSTTTATAFFLCVAVGFCAVGLASLFQSRGRTGQQAHRSGPEPERTPADNDNQLRLNDILEKSK